MMDSFSVFESMDNSEAVHIYFDSLNNPDEYIGLCTIYYKYDSLNRVTSIEGWNSKGEPYYWDFAPLTKFQYLDYSNSIFIKKLQQTVSDFNSSKSSLEKSCSSAGVCSKSNFFNLIIVSFLLRINITQKKIT